MHSLMFFEILHWPIHVNVDWNDVTPIGPIKYETHHQILNAKTIASSCPDTSVDSDWWINPEWGFSDLYTILISLIYFVPLFV